MQLGKTRRDTQTVVDTIKSQAICVSRTEDVPPTAV